ncbi:hypothetical protein [Caproicibacter fermentans]|uniref:hypothetical protein n=1 Tax=Caproicibacter fermentans TaxID=2576756 RepID=UPI000827FEE5|nr:hypothetical protein [Caproicibacter fermentans]OCN03112.1 hypothetical protein A7X67_13340 [Clostridium sp. W14A]
MGILVNKAPFLPETFCGGLSAAILDAVGELFLWVSFEHASLNRTVFVKHPACLAERHPCENKRGYGEAVFDRVSGNRRCQR